ncbi:MAG: hypothetical protein R3Y23_01175 [Bacillota bacterium]
MAKSFLDKVIYAATQKPQHYVHVDKPKTLQDRRQVQYNNWCKRYGVYNGSYLPEEPETLLKKGKGWKYLTEHDVKKSDHKEYQRKSSGQMIMFDNDKINEFGRLEEKHYHWQRGASKEERKTFPKESNRVDRYGNTCGEHSEPSHLAPKDEDYNWIYRGRKGGKK